MTVFTLTSYSMELTETDVKHRREAFIFIIINLIISDVVPLVVHSA